MLAPQFDPIAFGFTVFGFHLAVHWYGITYLVAFASFYWLAVRRTRLPQHAATGWSRRDVEDLLFFGVLGTVLGGRLGYVLFYKPGFYFAHPAEIVAVWKGGMSFHGGLLGVLAAMALFARTRGRRFFEVSDLAAPCVPIGIAVVRIGNFINGELWGRPAPADLPWAMIFPQSPEPLVPRHPSQLYQALLEGLLLFAIVWLFARKPRGLGQISGVFLAGYGVLRFIGEFFRQPDDFLGFLALGMTMGQWLCVPMIAGGIGIWLWGRGRPVNGPSPRAGASLASGRA